MVRLVFRPYTQVGRPICTSGPLRASTRVSSGFALPRHSSPSFGSYRARSRSTSPDGAGETGRCGEVQTEGAVKHAAGAASHLRPEPFQADLEPVAAHRHGGNAPGRGQPNGAEVPRGDPHAPIDRTCRLSVSCQYLALDGVYHPLWAAFPNNPTPRRPDPRRDGGRYRPHTVHGMSLDQKDSGPRATPGKRSSIRHMSPIRPSDGDSALGSSLFARRY
ncbi:hypothetical protein VZT92_020036 [Zoarces viviparus]|uniref:Uncharacterized protein n=1 Tax=Zoarces viviparus TaxID=48416 RepID=A0AAW1EIR5_ZOAVI